MKRRLENRGQEGFLLMTALGLLLVYTIVTIALLSMTITMMRVTQSHSAQANRLRAADGALEIIINQLRLDPDAAGSGCVGSSTHSGFASSYEVETLLADGTTSTVVVQCAADSVTSSRRVLSFTARPRPGLIVSGRARVRIDDAVGTAASPGVAMMVCDWQLGEAVSASLAACPTT